MGYNTEIRRKRCSPGQRWLRFGGQVTLGLLAFDLLQLAQTPPITSIAKVLSWPPLTVVCNGRETAVLPEGQMIGVDEIAHVDGEGRTLTWDADGHLVATPDSSNAPADYGSKPASGSTYRVLLSMSGPGIPPLGTIVAPAEDPSITARVLNTTYKATNGSRTALVQLTSLPTGAPSGRGAFRFGVTYPKTYTIAEEPLPGRIGRSRGPRLGLKLEDRSGKPECIVTFRLPAELAAQQHTSAGKQRVMFKPVAVDWLGKQYAPTSSGNLAGERYKARFANLSPAMIYSIRLVAAPVEWVEFDNLPLDYDHNHEIPARSYPITRAAVERVWEEASAGGNGELLRIAAPLPSFQIVQPRPDSITLGIGAVVNSSIEQDDNCTRITAYVPEYLSDRPFTLTVLDIQGRKIPLECASAPPAGEGTRGFVFTARDIDPRDIRAVSVRMQRR